MVLTMRELLICYVLFVLVVTATAAPILGSELEDLKRLIGLQNIDYNGRKKLFKLVIVIKFLSFTPSSVQDFLLQAACINMTLYILLTGFCRMSLQSCSNCCMTFL